MPALPWLVYSSTNCPVSAAHSPSGSTISAVDRGDRFSSRDRETWFSRASSFMLLSSSRGSLTAIGPSLSV